MATKAERFRYADERSGKPRPPKPRPRRNKRLTKAVMPGAETGRRNVSHGRKATVAFESAVVPSPPSRKSTRRSKNRQKAGTPLKARQTLETTAPRSQHARMR